MAFYSKRSKVYHTKPNCPVGKAVKKNNRIQGKGGRKLCNFCKTTGKGKMVKKATPKRKVKKATRPTRRPKRRRR
ncbi:MAG: hypothetical protein WBD28_09580 [Candidatus Zixiibacteriota bacterium]